MFGKTLADFQLTQAALADMATAIDAAALLTYRAAWLRDSGRPVTLAAAMAKMTATESAQQVIDRALQMFGGRGVERGEVVERLVPRDPQPADLRGRDRGSEAHHWTRGVAVTHKVLQPAEWARAKGYSNGIAARGTQVFIAGPDRLGRQSEIRATRSLRPQVRVRSENVVRVLEEAGGRPEHIVRLTWYLTSRREYLDQLPANRRSVPGRDGPALPDDVRRARCRLSWRQHAKVEIEATAVVPDP